MRLGTLRERPVVIGAHGAADLARASGGRYPTMAAVLADWAAFRDWVARARLEFEPFAPDALGLPVPLPGQVFGVGLNYVSHLEEAGRSTDRADIVPLVFTKFPSSLCAHHDDVLLRSDHVDWEVELVAVVGTEADQVPTSTALDHVAGYLVAQDLSDRAVQRAGQLSPGKSFKTYAPCGPWFLTADEVPDPQALSMRCWIDDQLVQDASTSDMLYGVAELIAMLSALTPLRPGDLVFTGTAAGVGVFRSPRRFLRDGEVLRSEIDGLGAMRNTCRRVEEPADPMAALWRADLPEG